MLNPEQLTATNMANIESLTSPAIKALEGVEQRTALNIRPLKRH